jgi:hypothetical protein
LALSSFLGRDKKEQNQGNKRRPASPAEEKRRSFERGSLSTADLIDVEIKSKPTKNASLATPYPICGNDLSFALPYFVISQKEKKRQPVQRPVANLSCLLRLERLAS